MPLKIAKSEIKRDPALHREDPGARGDRKILVTKRWPDGERIADEVDWHPPRPGALAPVMEVEGIEFAVFTEAASQDRHHHKAAFEIYTVLEGQFVIEVEGCQYGLAEGDTLVVKPGECHEVLGGARPFIAQVVIAPCRGQADKFDCD